MHYITFVMRGVSILLGGVLGVFPGYILLVLRLPAPPQDCRSLVMPCRLVSAGFSTEADSKAIPSVDGDQGQGQIH